MSDAAVPIRWDLVGEDAITQGAAWTRYSALEYTDAGGNVVTWSTTGYTARMQVRATIDGPVVLELTTANGRLQTGVAGWTIVLSLTAAASAGLADWGLGVYDLEIVDTFGTVTRIHYGAVALSREVTR